jgi:ADP-ribosylglycohydrolase
VDDQPTELGCHNLGFHIFTAPVKQHTDDAAMTKCLAESLIAQEKFDALDIAKR